MDAACADFLCRDVGWSAAAITVVNQGFARYWQRSRHLAARAPTWMPPRRRNLGVVIDPDAFAVRPYVQLLNTSTWLLYADDIVGAHADPEFLAYLLAHGDRMTITGEVTQAAIQNAAWWFERRDDECDAFAAAAEGSSRPDADAFRALATALPWLRQLRHETLCPPLVISPHRPIPGTGLLVPRAIEHEPPALIVAWTKIAAAAVQRYRTRWQGSDPAATTALCTWLAETAPPLLIMGQGERVLWDPEHPERLGAVRDVLRHTDAEAAKGITGDLAVIDTHTRRFLGALTAPEELPPPAANTLHTGLPPTRGEKWLLSQWIREKRQPIA